MFSLGATAFRLVGLASVLGLLGAIYAGGTVYQWALSLTLYFLYGCVGIAVTYHRYLAHRSFEMPKWRERILVLIGHLAGTGSAISWVSEHHQHHRFSDTAKDPHSPRNGLWRALTLDYIHTTSPMQVRHNRTAIHLARDGFYRFLHDYYLLLHGVWVACLYTLFGVDGVLFGHVVPVACVVIASVLTNFLGHAIGSQRYATNDDSKNSAVTASFSWGEGWHNNHHRYPGRPKFGEKWYEVDISWLVIRLVRGTNAR